MPSPQSRTFFTPFTISSLSIALRLALLLYGLAQDAYSPFPYTDIDYFVFTDAARYVSRGHSPYHRETYRYTPLLAWILVPTTWQPPWLWFSFGKIIFAIADLLAGWMLVKILIARNGEDAGSERKSNGASDEKRKHGVDVSTALKYASVWLLNPMVATISTRGSSEGLLGLMSAGLLWAALQRRVILAGLITGLGTHFKIYPFIYGVSILWYLEPSTKNKTHDKASLFERARAFITFERVIYGVIALASFLALNGLMYIAYGWDFLQHTFLHHLIRIDHRHNFSAYNTLLHLYSMDAEGMSGIRFEKLAFIPQLLLSAVLIPLGLAKKDLAGAMLCQTWAFVTFNKVVTSQYFLWYMIFLPLYLPYSTFLASPRKGIWATVLWTVTQAIWLQQAFSLEFQGNSTFFPGLFSAGLAFFSVNCWILSSMISDIGNITDRNSVVEVTQGKQREQVRKGT